VFQVAVQSIVSKLLADTETVCGRLYLSLALSRVQMLHILLNSLNTQT